MRAASISARMIRLVADIDQCDLKRSTSVFRSSLPQEIHYVPQRASSINTTTAMIVPT